MKILTASKNAFRTKGLLKAFLYSMGSAVLGVVIVYLAKPEVIEVFGKYAFIIPAINVIVVYGKQLCDEILRK